MTLSEAVKLSKETNKAITRNISHFEGTYLIPTKETIFIGFDNGKEKKDPAFGWQPNEQDLIADDWILID